MPVVTAMVGLIGFMAMESRVTGVTVNLVLPVTPPELAVIVVVPAEAQEARPIEPAVLKAATAGYSEFQLTDEVISLLELSE